MNENKEFTYSDSEDLGKGHHRQIIMLDGKEIGYLLEIETNFLAPLRESYVLPDIEKGLTPGGESLMEGKEGWIEFRAFTSYEEAFKYASVNLNELAHLFKVGDYD